MAAINHPVNDQSPSPEAVRRRSIATTFKRRDEYEAMVKLRAAAESGNAVAYERLERLDPMTRMSFGSYVNARDAALAEGIINDDGTPR